MTAEVTEARTSVTLAAARARMGTGAHRRPASQQRQPGRLSLAERAEAAEIIGAGGGCQLCAGLHAGTELSCPRLASFRLDGDGMIAEGTFWPNGQWEDPGRVILAEDAAEDGHDQPG